VFDGWLFFFLVKMQRILLPLVRSFCFQWIIGLFYVQMFVCVCFSDFLIYILYLLFFNKIMFYAFYSLILLNPLVCLRICISHECKQFIQINPFVKFYLQNGVFFCRSFSILDSFSISMTKIANRSERLSDGHVKNWHLNLRQMNSMFVCLRWIYHGVRDECIQRKHWTQGLSLKFALDEGHFDY